MADDCGWLAPRDGVAEEALARHLPTGVAWLAFRTPGKQASKLIAAISGVFQDAWAFLCKMTRELDPRTTEELIDNWERAVSMPDACWPKAGTLQERRDQVMFRLAMRRWTTAQDWHDLAEIFGLTIAITPGWYVQRPALYDFWYPKHYDIFPKLGRFRVYIDITNDYFRGYEYGGTDPRSGPGYAIPYGDLAPDFTAFQCLIERVRPANVVVIWNAFPRSIKCTHSTFSETFSETFC